MITSYVLLYIYHELFELFHYTIYTLELTEIFHSKSSKNLYFSLKNAFFDKCPLKLMQKVL